MVENKFIGCLIGCAIGDTLGMPVEIWNRDQIKKYHGRITEPIEPKIIRDELGNEIAEDELGKLKYWFRGLSKGDYTDDTILTLGLAKSLIEKGFDLENVAKGQLHEYITRQRDDGGHNGGFGGTTREACERLKAGILPSESGVIGGPGNAPCMKMAPLGLYMFSKNEYEKGLEFAGKVGKITHLDPRSIVSGIMQAHAIFTLLKGTDRDEFLKSIYEICKDWEEPLTDKFTWHASGNMTSKIAWIIDNKDVSVEEAYQHLGVSSAVYKSYPFVLFMIQKYWDNPIEGLIETVNSGGDCDTTGAMYGSLIGARDGIEIFPEKWVNAVKDKNRIINIGKELYRESKR